MQVKLHCPNCHRDFAAEADPTAGGVLDRMADQGPWQALGDGVTFEDTLSAALEAGGGVRCPECKEAVPVTEEHLGHLALAVLNQW